MSFPILLSVRAAERWLEDHQTVVLDTRNDLHDGEHGLQQYERARVAGAWYVNPGTDLETDCNGKKGRHPLRTLGEFFVLLSYLGLNYEKHYIIYDFNSGQFAAWLCCMMR